ncbi:hypothetical protein INS49_009774 [Diaporthe citri]|uniref:uncharacterized protein n=1 Tax=Diaporthe citri TaxID=83186 RepID=UPI001C7EDE04|nr:uncharacterized protein INS49_009774 [Diaporthe citri]KAG6361547.1 hypothetical protein INS49_009774 [Diaporthe citri]
MSLPFGTSGTEHSPFWHRIPTQGPPSRQRHHVETPRLTGPMTIAAPKNFVSDALFHNFKTHALTGLKTESNSESYSYFNVQRTQRLSGSHFYPIQLTSGASDDPKCRTTNSHAE